MEEIVNNEWWFTLKKAVSIESVSFSKMLVIETLNNSLAYTSETGLSILSYMAKETTSHWR